MYEYLCEIMSTFQLDQEKQITSDTFRVEIKNQRRLLTRLKFFPWLVALTGALVLNANEFRNFTHEITDNFETIYKKSGPSKVFFGKTKIKTNNVKCK